MVLLHVIICLGSQCFLFFILLRMLGDNRAPVLRLLTLVDVRKFISLGLLLIRLFLLLRRVALEGKTSRQRLDRIIGNQFSRNFATALLTAPLEVTAGFQRYAMVNPSHSHVC